MLYWQVVYPFTTVLYYYQSLRLVCLPEGFEIVLSDSELGATLLQAASINGVSTSRPAGQKTEGTV